MLPFVILPYNSQELLFWRILISVGSLLLFFFHFSWLEGQATPSTPPAEAYHASDLIFFLSLVL